MHGGELVPMMILYGMILESVLMRRRAEGYSFREGYHQMPGPTKGQRAHGCQTRLFSSQGSTYWKICVRMCEG